MLISNIYNERHWYIILKETSAISLYRNGKLICIKAINFDTTSRSATKARTNIIIHIRFGLPNTN